MNEESGLDGELENQVVEFVERYWCEHDKPLLLSRLGSEELGQQAKAVAGSLSKFIETRLRGHVQLIRHKSANQLIGAIPRAADARGSDHSELLELTQSVSRDGEERFAPAFWAAFRKPLATGHNRWVRSERPVRFEDVREGSGAAQGFVEIDRSYIVEPGGDAGAVLDSIEAWRKGKGVDLDAYLRKGERESGRTGDDLLGQILGRLNSDEMRRVTMPLDVVETLRRRPR